MAGHRGLALLGVSSLVWGTFSLVVLLTLPWVVDLPTVASLFQEVASETRGWLAEAGRAGLAQTARAWAGSPPEGLVSAGLRISSGQWLTNGWPGLAVAAAVWLLGYLACLATATTGCVTLAWAWLERGHRMTLREALHRGARRAPQTAAALGAWAGLLWACWLLVVAAPTAWLAGRGLWWGVAMALPLGLAAMAGVFLWLASRWALASQAASLSGTGWRALGTASQVTAGRRGPVLGRWLLTGASVSAVVGLIGAGLLALAGRLPDHVLLVSGVIAVRVALSASQAAFTAAATTSMYVDLEGDTRGVGRAG